MEALLVAAGVVVPPAAFTLRTARSSAPGGQNVNKVASKVDLRVDLTLVRGLDGAARRRLEDLSRGRRDAAGLLRVVSQRTRDQRRNLEDARERVRDLVARALVRPRVRRPTGPTAAARAERLSAKRRLSARKRGRHRPAEDE